MELRINGDGTLDLSTGDLSLLKEDGYIGQTIYSHLMELPTTEFAAKASSVSNSAIVLHIKQFLQNRLSNDPIINTSLIDVTVNSSVGSSLVIETSYDGKSLTSTDGYSTPSFSLVAGASPLVDRNPIWLNYANYDTSVVYPVSYNITLTEQSNKVEIPILPTCDQGAMIHDGTFSCEMITATNASLVNVGSYRIETFNISISESLMVYPISKYLPTVLRVGAETVTASTINSTGNVTSSVITMKDGELCLVTKGSGVISITATVSPIGTFTTSVYLDSDKEKEKVLHPLKPVRGKLYAVFPKTLKPGAYVIAYSAYKQRSIW